MARRDHPRSRGVYGVGALPPLLTVGSSPLARGLLLVPLKSHDGVGIIPARAGFTVAVSQARLITTDHPRSRGVYQDLARAFVNQSGSSPLARGLPDRAGVVQRSGRIIPARAGFTRASPAGGAR